METAKGFYREGGAGIRTRKEVSERFGSGVWWCTDGQSSHGCLKSTSMELYW